MADFYQTGIIVTLHRLGRPSLERIESEMVEFSKHRPIALVLPALYTEFQAPALQGIIDELKKVKYVNEVVLTLGRATDEEFKKAKEFMAQIPYEVKIIHNEGARIKEIYATLERNGLWAGEDGKGRSAWIAYGYTLANARSDVIALHDCDIVTYSREMLARLCYPVVNPNIDVVFCKGFYSRVTDRMHGRVTRLLITPLTRALQKVVGFHPFLVFLDSFRYPLAGEFCMITDLARVNRIPWDWGLEVGVLAEVFRNYSPQRVCQVDIADNYEHKHQPIAGNGGKGLVKMCVDISKSIFRTLAAGGIVFSDGLFKSLEVTYLRLAEDTIVKYEADAAINGLVFDRHEEAKAVEAFANAIKEGASTFMENPMGTPLIPNWNRVTSAIPGILAMLKKAVDEDNK
ncbi:MAG: glycosyl transferase [Deltaproteobacteria bacterium GWC2_42_51]|nr:MAG: glycosyl transferase [Deltaproteobacteria bacterium GWA2_42_85]OGP37170.1 MAG: glycosyl transferase [Deltaproteobacteria bacterium GWC2_42_51]OGP41590.1 MAG: glycosyl transferase [Deltaproteobacteria bacterium GWD2_42_10]OGP46731.1 MAG: glycosyl transferase [Deltaproteobacteria bacterium GWF2_42_12]OGQ23939.1 MAG: glycosyl transferase [Deltaproteobacteria bacterium RIFCSPHIGHO2_02_FULL_42_44]OGQ36246.1 MAG: glycosyl transferase [Deltaproteobacteria bacterium RIFCSPLOWO2_02_FULL_42_39]